MAWQGFDSLSCGTRSSGLKESNLRYSSIASSAFPLSWTHGVGWLCIESATGEVSIALFGLGGGNMQSMHTPAFTSK